MNQKEMQWFGIEKKSYYNQYGTCINVSTGLILGLFIDKTLFYITKGLSVLIPPFSVMLLNKGFILTKIRFEKQFHPLIEKYIITHLK